MLVHVVRYCCLATTVYLLVWWQLLPRSCSIVWIHRNANVLYLALVWSLVISKETNSTNLWLPYGFNTNSSDFVTSWYLIKYWWEEGYTVASPFLSVHKHNLSEDLFTYAWSNVSEVRRRCYLWSKKLCIWDNNYEYDYYLF